MTSIIKMWHNYGHKRYLAITMSLCILELAILIPVLGEWVKAGGTNATSAGVILFGVVFITIFIAAWVSNDYHDNHTRKYFESSGINVASIQYAMLDNKIVVGDNIWRLLGNIVDVSEMSVLSTVERLVKPSGNDTVCLRIDNIHGGGLGIYIKE